MRTDANPRDPVTVFQEFHRTLKSQVHTALPGTVLGYDRATRRADVQPSLDMLLEVDSQPHPSRRSIIRNAPVVWPGSGSSGGITMHAQLAEGDQVLLVYSMRGYRAWLNEMKNGVIQDLDGLVGPGCPFVIPWCGSIDDLEQPVTGDWGDGVWIQTRDGTKAARISSQGMIAASGANMRSEITDSEGEIRYGSDIKAKVSSSGVELQFDASTKISITSGGITMTVGGSTFALTSGGAAFTTGAFTHNGKNVGDTHTHSGVTPGALTSGPPV